MDSLLDETNFNGYSFNKKLNKSKIKNKHLQIISLSLDTYMSIIRVYPYLLMYNKGYLQKLIISFLAKDIVSSGR